MSRFPPCEGPRTDEAGAAGIKARIGAQPLLQEGPGNVDFTATTARCRSIACLYWICHPGRRSANASRISAFVFMTKGPPIATGSSMIGLAKMENQRGHRRPRRQRVVAITTRRRNGPRDVSGLRLPLLRAERRLALEHIGEGALAGGNGRIERRAGRHLQIDQRHRPCRRMRNDNIAELVGIDARLDALAPVCRRVRSQDVLVARRNALQPGGRFSQSCRDCTPPGPGISLCMTPPPAVMNCTSPAPRRRVPPV